VSYVCVLYNNKNLILTHISLLGNSPVLFGHPNSVDEGRKLYSRRYLYSVSAHRADQRGINGNIKYGADSLVVSRQNPQLREEDGLQWLRYTSSRRQGAGALCLSYTRRQPVRVFRSSNLTSCYAPPEFDGGRTSYRYDGLCKFSVLRYIIPCTCFVSSAYIICLF